MIISIILSSIAAVAAILAPLLTAIFNNRHNMKIKNLDLIYSQKYEVYKNFSTAYGEIQFRANLQDVGNFISSLYELMILCNENIRSELFILASLFKKNKNSITEQVEIQFKKCCELLHSDLMNEIKRKKY